MIILYKNANILNIFNYMLRDILHFVSKWYYQYFHALIWPQGHLGLSKLHKCMRYYSWTFIFTLISFTLTYADIQSSSMIYFSEPEYSTMENSQFLTVQVICDNPTDNIQVNFGMTICSTNSQAKVMAMPLTWKPGDPHIKTIIHTIIDNNEIDDNKTYQLILSNPSHNAILGAPSIATLTIIDDEIYHVYFVSKSGSDSNPGTIDEPWLTLENAAYKAKPGDIILIREGIYKESLSSGQSGESNRYITYRNYNNEKVIIDASGMNHGVILWNRSYIKISGIHVINATMDGILIGHSNDYLSDNNVIENMTVKDCINGAGIAAIGNNNRFLQNTVSGCKYGISFVGNHNLMQGNDIFENSKSGMSCLGDHNMVQKNKIHNNCEYGLSIWVGDSLTLNNLTFQFNDVVDNQKSALCINGGGPGAKPDHIYIYNNTIIHSHAENAITIYNTCNHVKIKNNIIAGMYDHSVLSLTHEAFTGFEEDYNIFYNSQGFYYDTEIQTFSDYQKISGQGLHSLLADPHLNTDLTLSPESIAIDSGVNIGEPIFGYAADIGAHEFAHQSNVPSANFSSNQAIGASPLVVQFFAPNHSTHWEWDFDTNGTIDSIENNPIYTYTMIGNHDVSLTVYNQNGSNHIIKPNYITVTGGHDYYVSINEGDDTNPGSLNAPFQTIQKCAETASRGDRCHIRQGIYREMITPKKDQITFTAYQDEIVTISGAEIIPNHVWSLHDGNIYKTPINWSLNVRRSYGLRQISSNQVFVNGKMMVEARWPNIDVQHVTKIMNISGIREDNAKTDDAQLITYEKAIYKDADLALAGDFWIGGKINLAAGYNFIYTTGDITDKTNASVTIEFHDDPGTFNHRSSFDNNYLYPQEANYYYLWGKLEALDYPGEWFIDPPDNYSGDNLYNDTFNGTLYLQLPDNSNPAESNDIIEVKKRNWAFDLRGKANTTICNIQIFASGILTDTQSQNTLISNIEARYVSHFREIPPFYNTAGTIGIQLYGSNNTIRDSYIAYSAGGMIALQEWIEENGNNRIINNVIHDVSYTGNGAAVTGSNITGTSRHIITQNTLFNSGLSTIVLGSGVEISYNDVYHSHLQCTDAGVINGWGIDGKDSIISYNFVHDSFSEFNGSLNKYGAHGIYLDEDTYNFTVYRNITWHTSAPGIAIMGTNGTIVDTYNEFSSSNRKIYNNTVDGVIAAYIVNRAHQPPQHMIGTEFINNCGMIFYNFQQEELTLSNNYEGDGIFSDKSNYNYALKSYSPLIDRGKDIQQYTQGYTGEAPDIGAIESTDESFVAGAITGYDDLKYLDVSCNRVVDTFQCQVTNLPIGRKLPKHFEVVIGDSHSGFCHTIMDYETNFGTGICHLTIGNLSGEQPIMIQLDDNSQAIQKGTIHIEETALAVHALSPSSGSVLGGYSITITGQNFDPSPEFYEKTQSIVITNQSGQSLYNHQICITLDTNALISKGDMKHDCGDIRLHQAQETLPYWLEQGCNTTNTRIWVKVPFIPEQDSIIYLTYGHDTLTSQSSGKNTFIYFDDFENGIIGSAYDISQGNGVIITETNGRMSIYGETTSSNPYQTFGFNFITWDPRLFWMPENNFAIDSEMTVLSGSNNFKAYPGSSGSALALVNSPHGDPLGKDIGYWNGSNWEIYGRSRIQTAVFENKKLSFACQDNGEQSILRLFEDGELTQPLAQRTVNEIPLIGVFHYGPNTEASFEVQFDNIRLRSYIFPEPLITMGKQTSRVEIGGQPCETLHIINSTTIQCQVPPGISGSVDIKVTNPNGETGILQNGFEYQNVNTNN